MCQDRTKDKSFAVAFEGPHNKIAFSSNQISQLATHTVLVACSERLGTPRRTLTFCTSTGRYLCIRAPVPITRALVYVLIHLTLKNNSFLYVCPVCIQYAHNWSGVACQNLRKYGYSTLRLFTSRKPIKKQFCVINCFPLYKIQYENVYMTARTNKWLNSSTVLTVGDAHHVILTVGCSFLHLICFMFSQWQNKERKWWTRCVYVHV